MSEYIVTERTPGIFTVAKFGDRDIPDHIATVTPNKRKVVFNYYHPPTPKIVDKYVNIVKRYLSDSKPHCMIYSVTEDLAGGYIIHGNSYLFT